MKNILIIRFSALGDLVTLEPTFRAIKYFFSDTKIHFLTSNIGKGLYTDSDYFDKFIVHESLIPSVKQLSHIKFDLVINLQCNKPSHYMNLFLKKDKTVNKSYSLLGKIFKIKTKSKSIQEILESAGIEKNRISQYFQSNQEMIQLPTSKLDFEFEKIDSKKYIAISTGSSQRWLSKKWGVEKYANLIEKLLLEDYRVVLVGGSLELEEASSIFQRFPEIINLVNKTNLTQLKNFLSLVDLYIGNDSGPTHIAAAIGTSTITIFGSTDIKHCPKYMPYIGEHICIKPRDSITCHPCYKPKCPTQMECMESIEVEEILLKVKEILA